MKTFVERFDYAEIIAKNKMWEIMQDFEFYLNQFLPFPSDLAKQKIQDFEIFIKGINDLHTTTADILPKVLFDKLKELERNHKFTPIETPIHDREKRIKEIRRMVDEEASVLNSDLIKEVLDNGRYDDFAKNILNEMLVGKRKYDQCFVISYL